MSEGRPHDQKLPTDFAQIPVVWRYELLRYFRSWRLVASIAISVAILALIYLLPPLLGTAYSGTVTNKPVYVVSSDTLGQLIVIPGAPDYIGLINKSSVDLNSLVLYLDGSEYPTGDGATWSVSRLTYQGASIYVVFFMQNITGHVLTASYDWYTAPDSFASLFLQFGSFLIVIAATLFGADSLAGEFQNRTGYLMFPTPMKRWVMYFGKYAASLTATLMVIGLFYAGLAGLSAISANGIDDGFGVSFAYAVEYSLAVLAVAYLISSVMKGTTGATVLTFLMFIILLPIIDGVSNFAGVKIEGSLSFASGVITNILIDPYPTDWSQEFGDGMSFNVFYPTPWIAAIVMFAYLVVATALSLILFKRKQLTG